MNKNTGKHKGKLCSGYGFFPGGDKCKGCPDCKGKNKVKYKSSLITIKNRKK